MSRSQSPAPYAQGEVALQQSMSLIAPAQYFPGPGDSVVNGVVVVVVVVVVVGIVVVSIVVGGIVVGISALSSTAYQRNSYPLLLSLLSLWK